MYDRLTNDFESFSLDYHGGLFRQFPRVGLLREIVRIVMILVVSPKALLVAGT